MKEADEFRYPIPDKAAFLGVLSLDGKIRSVEGMLPAIIAAKKIGNEILYLPIMMDIPLQHIKGLICG